MEEANQQKAQLVCRRVSRKGNDEDKGEALSSEGLSMPRKGRGRENIRCWNCKEMGHYSRECKKLKKAKDVETKAPGTSVSAVEPDAECEGAWAAELVKNAIEEGPGPVLPISEMDWFGEAVAMMDAEKVIVAEEIPHEDWFYEIAESDDESEDEGASSGGISVDGFDSDVSEGGFVRDLNIVGHVWPVCDNNFEGADRLSSTLLGLCLFEAPVAPAVYPEGEFGGGTICESSDRLPDLDGYENSWIDATMEWQIHAIVLRGSAEVITCPLEEPRKV
jgi:hypothetical protein